MGRSPQEREQRGLARVTGGATAAVRAVGLLGVMLTHAKEAGYIEDHNSSWKKITRLRVLFRPTLSPASV